VKKIFKAAVVAGSLLIIVLLSACGSATASNGGTTTTQATVAPTPTPTTAPTPTPTPQTVPTGFTQFKGSSFTVAYPSDWHHQQASNYYSFVRTDVITQFIVGLHNNDKDPCAFLQHVGGTILTCTEGDIAGVKHTSTVTANGLTWKEEDWTASLAGSTYALRQLTYVNPQTHDTTTIVYAGYSQVGSAAMITFEVASSKYFEIMFMSFHFTS